TPRERAFIEALDVYYRRYPGGHQARTQAYEAAMARVHDAFPEDVEASTFYALAILEAVDLTDKTYARQLKAGALLEPILTAYPDHPGAPHYLIHAYDYAPLASRALAAAKREAEVAPGAAHAQHMPSHIYTILGRWDESIDANHRAARVLDPSDAGNVTRSDIENGHGFDFIVYARLQKTQDAQVAADLAALRKKRESFTVVEARYMLEREDWKAAASLAIANDPFDAAIARFVRGYGFARLGDTSRAKVEVTALRALCEPLLRASGEYWAAYTDIYALAVHAWGEKAAGRPDAAIAAMKKAADMDDAREKSINLENKLLPMREVLGELFLALNRPREAADAFAQSLQTAPNRFRSFAGAAWAARMLGDAAQARELYGKLLALAADGDGKRPEIAEATAFSGK
ncbi:MAG: hypothetical protein JOZ16_13835, partial [Methylobacteriaceae bacterium]|nr:hypothetical protein [Methylobacteriaceae bacterium]